MGKKWVQGLAALLAPACLLLGGCGEAPAPGSGAESSVSAPASVAASTPALPESLPAEELDEAEAEILACVNGVLAGYQNGSYPGDILYHTDAYGIMAWPPPGFQLPGAVRWDAVALEEYYDELYGGEALTATAQLGDGYALVVDIVTFWDEQPYTARSAAFQDLRGATQLEEAAAPGGGRFTHVTDDRVAGSAGFEGLPSGHGLLAGRFSWQKGGFLWLDFEMDGRYFMHTFRMGAGGAGSGIPHRGIPGAEQLPLYRRPGAGGGGVYSAAVQGDAGFGLMWYPLRYPESRPGCAGAAWRTAYRAGVARRRAARRQRPLCWAAAWAATARWRGGTLPAPGLP